ncbi:AAC(3) family N-acetyltransferase [Dactylosporangium sp. AC04546]|uniref:aminoglycoside N(3)-acetyltransferase n=1 Tax=Dactylosporangium sp. AC04546 TaxID=2862460 RepID=UPI001EDEA72F|nr:AAC(3) family N-acetyltransferase [Dactylosporangium sp. AC04546]WVK83537.1 AAC(3) family N-acetyltransferase [Dactylosporangium sp. AC04546]
MTATIAPVTYRRLLDDLRRLGVPHGRHLLVHTAMSRMGYVVGGPGTLLHALRDVVGPASVVVPTQTADNSTTSHYYREATVAMDQRQREVYEATLPGFDPVHSPSYRMGAFAEHVRRHRAAVRSHHPQTSFTALGRHADDLMRVHDLTSHLGPHSPLKALYDADAMVLLVGVGVERCTALHLAEYGLERPPRTKTYTCFLRHDHGPVRYEFDAPDLDDGDFGLLGADLCRERWAVTGTVGGAPAILLPIRRSVDFATAWMNRQRSVS